MASIVVCVGPVGFVVVVFHTSPCFRVLLCQRACHSDGRHSAREGKWCDHDELIAFGHFDDAPQHGSIVAQWRVGIDDGE